MAILPLKVLGCLGEKDFYELNKYSVKTHKQSCFIQNYGYFAA